LGLLREVFLKKKKSFGFAQTQPVLPLRLTINPDLDNIEVDWYRIILRTDQILEPPILFLIITVEY